MALDLPHSQASRIHRHDLVVETRKATLILGDQLRIESPLPVARNRNLQLRRFGQNLLPRVAIAAVTGAAALILHFLPKMVVYLGVQHPFRQRLLQSSNRPSSPNTSLPSAAPKSSSRNSFLIAIAGSF